MGTMKKKYTEEQIKQENEIPQHVIDEEKVDEALERMRDQRQQDMYDDEMWNWSGLRQDLTNSESMLYYRYEVMKFTFFIAV